MTLVLNLPAEVEAELKAAAAARGEDVQTLLIEAARSLSMTHQARRKAIQSARGSLSRGGNQVSRFLQEKHADTAKEEGARFDKVQGDKKQGGA